MVGINKFLNIVIILGCVVIAFFFYQAKVENDKSAKVQNQSVEQSSVKPMDPQDLANKYLQQAQQNLATEELKASINIKKAIAESQQAATPPKVVETDPSKVPIEQQIWKDPAEQTKAEIPLEQRFSQELNQKNSGEIDKQEYIRQFKENARKNGYEITVNDDLEVTSVTPIRKPQNSKNDYDSNQNSESEY
ncbi:hypothetical protein [Pseudobdellovibrio sp. HCB154]|uniref:hypothetical protein n=1 Tax=Pseudobdellovibrio sp. HCB154 TaxID=3386277 RepID=UPI003916E4AB